MHSSVYGIEPTLTVHYLTHCLPIPNLGDHSFGRSPFVGATNTKEGDGRNERVLEFTKAKPTGTSVIKHQIIVASRARVYPTPQVPIDPRMKQSLCVCLDSSFMFILVLCTWGREVGG